MTKKNRLRLLFKTLFMQFGSVKTDEGVQLVWDPDTELMVGYDVYIEQENESGELEYVPAPDGEYKSGNTTFVISEGKCTEIRNEEPAQEEQMAEQPATEEQLAEETPAEKPAQEQPAEEPAQEQEPEFDAQKAIEDMRSEYDQKINDLTAEVSSLRVQVEALLALPQEENAFEKQTKEETNAKPLFKTRNQK